MQFVAIGLLVLGTVTLLPAVKADLPIRDPECYADNPRGRDYRGSIHVSNTGKECMYWTAQDPHVHNRTAENYPDTGLGDHNYCRNPDNEPEGPWCFTTDQNSRWEYCRVGNASRDCSYGECWDLETAGRKYRGVVNITAEGDACQKWTEQTPHEHDRTPENFPCTGLGDHNYCRNPDNEPIGPWCFTTNTTTRWAYCNVGRGKRNCINECYEEDPMGRDYRGRVNMTESGKPCMFWNLQDPHTHNRTAENYPNTGIYGEHNYCRNPDDEPLGPWCFTTDPDSRWEYCDVGKPSKRCRKPANAKYFKEHLLEEIQEALSVNDKINKARAKNVILMVADGLDLATVTATRIFKSGPKGKLHLETLPHTGLAKTFNCDSQVADSASAGTALFSGVKSPSHTLGVDCTAHYGNCSTLESARVPATLLTDFVEAGRSAGLVTNRKVTDALPAALYGHTVNSDWQAGVPEEAAAAGCTDLASQLVDSGLNVIMGGGREDFLPSERRDPEYPEQRGKRTSGNLIRQFLGQHDHDAYVTNVQEFLDIDVETTDNVIGLFEPSHMKYEADRGKDKDLEPTLSEMTRTAIQILQKNDEGFFLLVHGGNLDHAHQENSAYNALCETAVFDAAVEVVMSMVDLEETLVIVTSDHASGMTMAGYPSIMDPILGLNDKMVGSDGLPFTTLQYNIGPGGELERRSYEETGQRRDLANVDTEHPYFHQSAIVPSHYGTNGGQDVPIYAAGPMSHMFQSTHDQTYIPFVAKLSACVGKYANNCPRDPRDKKYRKIVASP